MLDDKRIEQLSKGITLVTLKEMLVATEFGEPAHSQRGFLTPDTLVTVERT